MTNPLGTLRTELNTLATADTADPENGEATPSNALTVAGEVLSLLSKQAIVGDTISTAVSDVYTAIANAITSDVVAALQKIASNLGTAVTDSNLSDASSALTALQTALQTAQSLVPGASSAAASALASTTQFATMFANLLAIPGTTVKDAADALYEIAQQLEQIAKTFSNAAPTQ